MPKSSIPIQKGIDPKLQEDDYVHTVYNEIASHFSQTRFKPWPVVEQFLLSRPDHSVGLDVGCGNGKYLSVNDKLFMIGTDRSDGLIKCAYDNSSGKFNLGVADGLHLPHRNDSVDFAISIAVIHHFATRERRIDAMRHILSKVRKGGEILVYCWALEQENSVRGYKEGDEQDILIPWVLQKKQEKKQKPKRAKRGDSGAQSNEAQEGNVSEEVFQDEPQVHEEPITKYRYYHLYKKGELVEDALEIKECAVVDHGYQKDNWWVIVKKI